MSSLENQNVVIIGGTSGIGLAAAILADAEGANVWAASRSKDRINQCQEKVSQSLKYVLQSHQSVSQPDKGASKSENVHCPEPGNVMWYLIPFVRK